MKQPSTNLVNHIGNKVTVYHTTGNIMEERVLLTVDTFGIAVTAYQTENITEHVVFVPWPMVTYVDLIQPQE